MSTITYTTIDRTEALAMWGRAKTPNETVCAAMAMANVLRAQEVAER